MREINNKLDCCDSDNKKWCESAIDLIPIYIREINKRIESVTKYYKEQEKRAKNASSNIKKLENFIDAEKKEKKEREKSMKNTKKSLALDEEKIKLYEKQLKIFKKRTSISCRCAKGTHRNKKNNKCEKNKTRRNASKRSATISPLGSGSFSG